MSILLLLTILLLPHFSLTNEGLSEFYFTKQPQDLVQKRGDNIRMHCEVNNGTTNNGTTNYQYFWYKSPTPAKGSHSISKSRNEYLQQTGHPYYDINSVQPSDSGYYHCVVRTGATVVDAQEDSKYGAGDANYSLVSNVGYLKVEYFDKPKLGETITKVAVTNSLKTFLPCDLPESEPPVEAVWYKDDEIVSSPRMFVVPSDQVTYLYSAVDPDRITGVGPPLKRGTLCIVMVETGDAGVYTCKTTYEGETHEVAKVDLQLRGMIGQPPLGPEGVVEAAGRAGVGETATLFCAAFGNPVPTVSWSLFINGGELSIFQNDTYGLSDHNRRLTIVNVTAELSRHGFICTLTSPTNGRSRKTIISFTFVPSQINFREKPSPHVIRPNTYTSFTLQCSITVEPATSPVMYWVKNGASLDLKPPGRIRSKASEEKREGRITVKTIELIFNTPNESDRGVYQCIVEYKGQMRQATTYVDVEKVPLKYEVYHEQEYQVFINPMKIGEASEQCTENWKPRGHLVTIANQTENEHVFGLLVEAGVTKAWIGLTSKSPLEERGIWKWEAGEEVNTDLEQRGIWKWEAGEEVNTDFSYWYREHPDNALGDETHAILDVSRAGHWLDVNDNATYPFVCSRYKAKCPSVAQFFNNSVKPVLGDLETADQEYDVGKDINVTCVDEAKRNVTQKITCLPSGLFQPSTVPCAGTGTNTIINSTDTTTINSTGTGPATSHHVRCSPSYVIFALALFLLYRP